MLKNKINDIKILFDLVFTKNINFKNNIISIDVFKKLLNITNNPVSLSKV